jgi:dTDP-4-amino-4,6-dideoxygalactose transaminase
MQFRDLKRQYEVLKNDIDRAMIDVASSSAYIGGKQVKQLETELAEYVGVRHCVSCANGTDALTLALKALGVGHGDAVFVPDFTFFSTAEVVSLEGATAVFVDVDMETYNISVADLEKKVEAVKREEELTLKAVIMVDLFGLPADYEGVREIADRNGMYVVEDGAQGFGGTRNGRRACSMGDICTTSFFPAKPLGCYGDGGACFTDNDEWAALMESYKVHGKGEMKYDNVRIGMNSRLDTLQAAILLVKFKAFRDYELTEINEVARRYSEMLKGVVKYTPVVEAGSYSSWAQYTIQLESREQRDRVQRELKEKGIPTMVYYPKPMHCQTVYKEEKIYGACPNAELLSETVLSLPIHPYMTRDENEEVVRAVTDFVKA